MESTALAENMSLLSDLRQLIEGARGRAAQAVNAELVMLYWHIGERIRKDILVEERAHYGEQIVSAVSAQLQNEYGRGFGKRNLFYMIRFAEAYPDKEIVHALSAQLSWTHLRNLIYLDDPLKRDFYTEMCRIERWSTRTLTKKIGNYTPLRKGAVFLRKQRGLRFGKGSSYKSKLQKNRGLYKIC